MNVKSYVLEGYISLDSYSIIVILSEKDKQEEKIRSAMKKTTPKYEVSQERSGSGNV